MELINGNSEIIKDFFQSMERMLEGIGKLVKESKPHLNGEKFLSNQEASKYLKVSIRTLQEWRDTGVIPYIQRFLTCSKTMESKVSLWSIH